MPNEYAMRYSCTALLAEGGIATTCATYRRVHSAKCLGVARGRSIKLCVRIWAQLCEGRSVRTVNQGTKPTLVVSAPPKVVELPMVSNHVIPTKETINMEGNGREHSC